MASIEMWYRGVDFCKDYLIKYLKGVFLAHQKGALVLTDGTVAIEFSRVPTVIGADSWVARDLPALLVSLSSGDFEERTFTKNLLRDESFDDDGEYRYFGGDINLSWDIAARARTKPERDRLVDATCIMLSHPAAKDFFLKHAIKLPKPPSIGGNVLVHEPAVDYPIYERSVTLPTRSMWQIREELEARLLDIIVDIIAVMDFD